MNYNITFVDKKTEEKFESLKGGKFEDKKLYEFINRAIEDLKKDYSVGINIPKKLIPKEYIQKYGIDNLRKYNLPGAWRLLYTVAGNDIKILSIIIEWMTHKEYERKFKY